MCIAKSKDTNISTHALTEGDTAAMKEEATK